MRLRHGPPSSLGREEQRRADYRTSVLGDKAAARPLRLRDLEQGLMNPESDAPLSSTKATIIDEFFSSASG
jgi:hypothetical protein